MILMASCGFALACVGGKHASPALLIEFVCGLITSVEALGSISYGRLAS